MLDVLILQMSRKKREGGGTLQWKTCLELQFKITILRQTIQSSEYYVVIFIVRENLRKTNLKHSRFGSKIIERTGFATRLGVVNWKL